MACNKMYQKSTVVANDTTSQIVATNGIITFPNSTITGSSITATSTAIKLNKSGLYRVLFNAFGVENGVSGSITAQLFKNVNGVNSSVAGAIGSAVSSSTTDVENIGFSTIVEVTPSCCCVNNSVVLTVQNTGIATNYGTTNIVVEKIA